MQNESHDNRRLIELLYLRDRTLHRLHRSTSLSEVWGLYQDLKLLNVCIARFEHIH